MTPPTILVVDEDRAARNWFEANLSREGFRVLTAGSDEEGLALAASIGPSLVLLDMATVGTRGLDLYRRITRLTGVPVIMISAGDDEIDAVLSLEAGAADHIRRPPKPRELAARIRAVLRRAGERPDARKHLDDAVDLPGPVRLDVARREVLVRGKPVVLSRKEFDLLALLVSEAGAVVTRAQCLDVVWQRTRPSGSRTLDTHVKRLRKKIELRPAEPRHVITVRGVGYRFKP